MNKFNLNLHHVIIIIIITPIRTCNHYRLSDYSLLLLIIEAITKGKIDSHNPPGWYNCNSSGI